jgi:CBS domain-containing protein
VERLRAANRTVGGSPEETVAELEAFHLIQRFRIGQQLATRDRERANRVDPSGLNDLHRLMLKEALKQAGKLQLRLRQDFQI